MAYHKHKLNSKNHSHILQRQDSVTGDTIKVNDEVVFCSACQSVFLVESWQYMNQKHCNQSETIDFVPLPFPVLKVKKKVRGKNSTDKLIFEFVDTNLAQKLALLPAWLTSGLVGIGINNDHWLIYFLIAIFSGIFLGIIINKIIQNKKIRKILKLDKKTIRLFEIGIELQNDRFYFYSEIEKIKYIKRKKLDSYNAINTYLDIHLKNGEIIRQDLSSKDYEKMKPFLFALARTAQFTALHFYTEDRQEKGIIESIERNYVGRILIENDLQIENTD